MARHQHTEVTYETFKVVGKMTHPVTGAEIDQRAQYTACSDCGKLLDDPHDAAPKE